MKKGVNEGIIGEKDSLAAMPTKPKSVRLYANPKIHKLVQLITILPKAVLSMIFFGY